MSSKLGTILSSIFIVIAFLLGCDLMSIQFIYSDLDSKSINISYLISKNATFFDDEFTNYIESKLYNSCDNKEMITIAQIVAIIVLLQATY